MASEPLAAAGEVELVGHGGAVLVALGVLDEREHHTAIVVGDEVAGVGRTVAQPWVGIDGDQRLVVLVEVAVVSGAGTGEFEVEVGGELLFEEEVGPVAALFVGWIRPRAAVQIVILPEAEGLPGAQGHVVVAGDAAKDGGGYRPLGAHVHERIGEAQAADEHLALGVVVQKVVPGVVADDGFAGGHPRERSTVEAPDQRGVV